jgi:hypothetical protein
VEGCEVKGWGFLSLRKKVPKEIAVYPKSMTGFIPAGAEDNLDEDVKG